MTKTLRIVIALGIASMMGLSYAAAGEAAAKEKACCKTAAEAGKACDACKDGEKKEGEVKACCKAAKEAGEVCKECKPAKKEAPPAS